MNSVYTRIIESDFIPKEQREDVLRRLTPAIERVEASPIEELSLATSRSLKHSASVSLTTVLMALGASLAGVLFSVLPSIVGAWEGLQQLRDLLPIAGATAVASLLGTGLAAAYTWSRERLREEPSNESGIDRYVRFEASVLRTLKRLAIAPQNMRGAKGYDFLITWKDKTIIVEIKHHTRRPPPALVVRTLNELREAKVRENASYAVIVTPNPTAWWFTQATGDDVKIMNLEEFRQHLSATQ